MLLQNKSIAIIGGGPGGLTLATLLQKKGVNVAVYERDTDKNARQQGTTLDLHEDSGLKALRIAGLLGEFKKRYRPGADKLRITDKNGTILHDDHGTRSTTNFGDEHFRPEIDRGPLREMLIDSLHPGSLHWNSKFSKMAPRENGWQLTFENKPPAYADLVIIADGANSKARKYLTDIPPVYSGITIIEGHIDHAEINAPILWEKVKGGKVFAIGDQHTLILSAKGDGSLSFVTGTKEPENWATECGIDFNDRAQVFAWFKKRFAGWSPIWDELFSTDESWFAPRPMYHFPLDQQWATQPNLTIIGDAAHRMPPYAGEGVNQAMQDALELYEALCESTYPSIGNALAAFEKKMCTRTAAITAESVNNTEWMHSPGGLEKLLDFFAHRPTE